MQKLQKVYNGHMTNRNDLFTQCCLTFTPPAKTAKALAAAKTACEDIIRRYSGPHRHYHKMSHITAALKKFDVIRDRLSDPDAVEMAIWLHDVIYDAKRSDNEEASARYAQKLLTSLGHTARTTNRVMDLIEATKHAHDARLTADAKYMVDIDLSSFGVPWKTFARNGANLRKEYAHLADADHTKNQIAFLGSMLARKHIYATQFFRERYEARARANITKTLDILRKSEVR